MRLAIALLLALAIASVIGTVLQQNQPLTDYLLKFGPLWHQVFLNLGLYDIYSAAWFLLIIAFLLVSVGTCLTRHVPTVLRQALDYREQMPEAALRRLANRHTCLLPGALDHTRALLQAELRRHGYRTRLQPARITAMKGRGNRLGYVFTHTSILLICIGGFLDSNALLKFKLMRGELVAETRELPVASIPAISRLPDSHRAFRSSVLIPEGKASNFSFINISSGYLLQSLPFVVELRDFRIAYYNSGQPKSFESDLSIRDPSNNAVVNQTIAVNRPMHYRGYTIYQSSFGDGGSEMQMRVHALTDAADEAYALSGNIDDHIALNTAEGTWQLELDDFRPHNVVPDDSRPGGFSDRGPSLQFKLRGADGSAIEFDNYLYPVETRGRSWFLSGMRRVANAEFHYLYLPADEDYSLQRFMRFHRALYDDALVREVADTMVNSTDPELWIRWGDMDIADAMTRFLIQFRDQGLEPIEAFVSQRAQTEAQQQQNLRIYVRLLQALLLGIYQRAMQDTAPLADDGDAERGFFIAAMEALATLPNYAAPVFIEVSDYQHREASGLQINRTPGARWVYLGFFLLLCGLMCQFFLSHQRIWIVLQPEQRQTRVIIGGTRTRHYQTEFTEHFKALCKRLEQVCAMPADTRREGMR